MAASSSEQEKKRTNLKIVFSSAQQNLQNISTPGGSRAKTFKGLGFSGLQHQAAAVAAAAATCGAAPGNAFEDDGGSAHDAVMMQRECGRLTIFNSAHSTGTLKFDGEVHPDFKAEDLGDLGEIGRGNFGTVNKMVFQGCKDKATTPCNKVMAVKRIRSTVDEREQKELLMDLEVVMKSSDCPYIVTFFGAIFKEGDCWICMELMDTSLDKFYKFIYEALAEPIIPEGVIGRVAVATVLALNYLKERLKIIHRDVKPSNILLDRRGAIKLCDFGISGQLVDSIAKTRDAGCRPYMAPERIDPQRAKGYDVRSDVWSLGITLIELSTGKFPYPKWNSVFEQLQQVVHGDPPRLDPKEHPAFSLDFVNFVNTCLIKDEQQRPKYTSLLKHNFIRKWSQADDNAASAGNCHVDANVDVAGYVNRVLDLYDAHHDAGEEMMVEMTSSVSS